MITITTIVSLLHFILIFSGKKAIFRTIVSGEPAPTVTWGRNKGSVEDPEKYKSRYDDKTQEHVLEVRKIMKILHKKYNLVGKKLLPEPNPYAIFVNGTVINIRALKILIPNKSANRHKLFAINGHYQTFVTIM